MHHCLWDRLGGRDVRDDFWCRAESVIRPAAEGRNKNASYSSASAPANRRHQWRRAFKLGIFERVFTQSGRVNVFVLWRGQERAWLQWSGIILRRWTVRVIWLIVCRERIEQNKNKMHCVNTRWALTLVSLGSLQKINNEQGWENCEKQSPGAAWLHHLWERLCEASSGNNAPRLPRHDGSADPLNELTEVSFGLWKQGTIRWVESSEGVVPLIRAPSTHTRAWDFTCQEQLN